MDQISSKDSKTDTLKIIGLKSNRYIHILVHVVTYLHLQNVGQKNHKFSGRGNNHETINKTNHSYPAVIPFLRSAARGILSL
jgi:hypothetical protein